MTILEILQQERADLEASLATAMNELREAQKFYNRFGDGSDVWRRKFDQRFRLSKRLQQVESQIRNITQEHNAAFVTAIN